MSINLDIVAVPLMDQEGLACFKSYVERSNCYLEYGCGGSTVYACTVALSEDVRFSGVDRGWADNV